MEGPAEMVADPRAPTQAEHGALGTEEGPPVTPASECGTPGPTDAAPDDSMLALPQYATDEFRIYRFKVDPCPDEATRPHDPATCPFSHTGEKAARRDPRAVAYGGTPCPDFRKGACRRGPACPFAHGVFEAWLHPTRYRTSPCEAGRGCGRRVCFFAHGPEEVRAVPPPRPDDPVEAAMAAASAASAAEKAGRVAAAAAAREAAARAKAAAAAAAPSHSPSGPLSDCAPGGGCASSCDGGGGGSSSGTWSGSDSGLGCGGGGLLTGARSPLPEEQQPKKGKAGGTRPLLPAPAAAMLDHPRGCGARARPARGGRGHHHHPPHHLATHHHAHHGGSVLPSPGGGGGLGGGGPDEAGVAALVDALRALERAQEAERAASAAAAAVAAAAAAAAAAALPPPPLPPPRASSSSGGGGLGAVLAAAAAAAAAAASAASSSSSSASSSAASLPPPPPTPWGSCGDLAGVAALLGGGVGGDGGAHLGHHHARAFHPHPHPPPPQPAPFTFDSEAWLSAAGAPPPAQPSASSAFPGGVSAALPPVRPPHLSGSPLF